MEPILLLLTKADFAAYADLPESLDMDRLQPHMLAAQLHRLQPVLTEPLLQELLRRVSTERAAASTETPAPLNEPWQGLRKKSVPLVACASLARYMPFSQTTVTSHSLVQKTSQYSQPVDGRELARMASIYDGEALSHEVTLRAWLHVNGHLFSGFYPQATACGRVETSSTPSVVVQAIRRPDDEPGSYPHYRR